MRILKSFIPSLILLSLLLVALPGFGQSSALPAATCPLHAGQTLSITASGNTEVIAIPTGSGQPIFNGAGVVVGTASSPKIVICAAQIQVNQAAGAADFGLVYGTGTACATGVTNLTSQWQGTASVKERLDFNYSTSPLVVPSGKAVCLKLSAAPTGARVLLTYNVVK